MKIKRVVTYGIKAGYNKGKKRFFVVCNGKVTSLHYARAAFTMEKSERFAKACYKNFVNLQGNQVSFIFKRED